MEEKNEVIGVETQRYNFCSIVNMMKAEARLEPLGIKQKCV